MGSIQNRVGAHQMDIFEAAAVVGFVLVATTLVTLVVERRMDVLHGAYIEGHESQSHEPSPARFHAMARLAEQLRWKARSIVYLTSLAPC